MQEERGPRGRGRRAPRMISGGCCDREPWERSLFLAEKRGQHGGPGSEEEETEPCCRGCHFCFCDQMAVLHAKAKEVSI